MLALSRKIGESVVIDGRIRVVVLETRGDRVRLGVDAPPDVRVLRAELVGRRLGESAAASTPEGAASESIELSKNGVFRASESGESAQTDAEPNAAPTSAAAGTGAEPTSAAAEGGAEPAKQR